MFGLAYYSISSRKFLRNTPSKRAVSFSPYPRPGKLMSVKDWQLQEHTTIKEKLKRLRNAATTDDLRLTLLNELSYEIYAHRVAEEVMYLTQFFNQYKI